MMGMSRSRTRLGGVLLVLPLLVGWDWLRSADGDVASGSRSWHEGAFADALSAFERALGGGGDVARVHFDIGTALYRLAEGLPAGNDRTRLLDRAESEFRLGSDTRDGALKSAAYYNLGNTHFVRERWADAIDAYKKALRAHSRNDDARYNLELALRELERSTAASAGGSGNQSQPGQAQPQPAPEAGQPGAPGAGQNPTPPPETQPAPPDQAQTAPEGAQGQASGPGEDMPEPAIADPSKDPAQHPEPPPETPPAPPQTESPEAGDQPATPQPASPDSRAQPRGGPPPAPDSRGERSGVPDSRNESERKMDELERRSLAMRKSRLRAGKHSQGNARVHNGKDW